MKNMIITIGALLLIITIMSFQTECNTLLREKKLLKFAADEAAASAALCCSEEAFGDGVLTFDREKAGALAALMVRLNAGDDAKMSIEYYDNDQKTPYLVVRVARGRITAVSEYEHVSYGM